MTSKILFTIKGRRNSGINGKNKDFEKMFELIVVDNPPLLNVYN